MALEAQLNDQLEVRIARPAFVVKKDISAVVSALYSVLPYIKVNALALAMLDTALNGSKSQTLENAELAAIGNPLLEHKP